MATSFPTILGPKEGQSAWPRRQRILGHPIGQMNGFSARRKKKLGLLHHAASTLVTPARLPAAALWFAAGRLRSSPQGLCHPPSPHSPQGRRRALRRLQTAQGAGAHAQRATSKSQEATSQPAIEPR